MNGEKDYDFHLFANKGGFAFKDSADFIDTTKGAQQTLKINKISPCTLYVGVKLNSTVTSNQDGHRFKDLFPEYSGDLKILNGTTYSINASNKKS